MQMTNRKIGYLVPCLTLALLTACGGGGGGSSGGAVPATTAVRSAYAYVANNAEGTISQYTIDSSTGALTPMSPATVCAIPPQATPCSVDAQNANPTSVTVDPAGKYAYVAISSGISQFTIGLGGELVAMSSSPVSTGSAGGPYSVTVDPTGRYAYSANSNSHDISAYNITNGALTFFQIINSGAGINPPGPVAVVVDQLGKYVYVANELDNNIAQFSIGPTGTLTLIATITNTGIYPVSMAVAKDGSGNQYLYVANTGSATVSEYRIGSNGMLSVNGIGYTTAGYPGSFPTSVAVAGDSTGSKYVYVTNGSTVSQYTINSDGTLAPMANTTITAGLAAQSVAVDITGSFVYVANSTGSTGLGTVSQYTVSTNALNLGELAPMSPTAELLSGSAVSNSQPFSIATAVLIQ